LDSIINGRLVSTFFNVFPQVVISGDAQHPLQILNNIILTETAALRLFGDVEKAIGQQIKSTLFSRFLPYTIMHIFFREYTSQVMMAGVVALPLAYYAMYRWLEGYAYRTNIPWWLLVEVITGVGAVVLLTVLGQVVKAANSNPAEVVKSE
jgi:hypothetical protein